MAFPVPMSGVKKEAATCWCCPLQLPLLEVQPEGQHHAIRNSSTCLKGNAVAQRKNSTGIHSVSEFGANKIAHLQQLLFCERNHEDFLGKIPYFRLVNCDSSKWLERDACEGPLGFHDFMPLLWPKRTYCCLRASPNTLSQG